jgi:mediator of RNA polymerase II transcription subunit 7
MLMLRQIHRHDPSIKELGLTQLFPSPPDGKDVESEWTLDRASYLKKFAKSILLKFLEIVGILAVNPEQYSAKIDHLSTLMYNAHFLINEYRPHQARETLIMMMEEQLERKEAEVEGINRMKLKVDQVLQSLGLNVDETAANSRLNEDSEPQSLISEKEYQGLWLALDEVVQDGEANP